MPPLIVPANAWEKMKEVFFRLFNYCSSMFKKLLDWCLANPDKAAAIALICIRVLDGDLFALADLHTII